MPDNSEICRTLPDSANLNALVFKECVNIHPGIGFQTIDGAIAIQTPVLTTVALPPARNQPHMLKDTTVYTVSVKYLPADNQSSTQVLIQCNIHRVLNIRKLP